MNNIFRRVTRVLSLSAICFATTLVSSLPSACSSSSEGGSGTTGKRITLAVTVTGSSEAKSSFSNSQGWNITLTKAIAATGPLYYYDGATIFSELEPSAPTRVKEFVREVLSIKSAFAHPGHYIPGNAKGEFLSASSVDLRTTNALGSGDGVSGFVRSATFSFASPATGPFAAELGSHMVILEGTATKGAEQRVFRAEIDAADVDNTKNAPQVEGCPFTETDMQADGMVTVTVNVKQWFDQVEFDTLPKSSDGKPVLFPNDAIGRNELVRGIKEGLGYQFTYTPKL